MLLSLASTVVLADHVMVAGLDETTALLDPVSGEYAALNQVGSLIVAGLDRAVSIGALCHRLCSTHDVDLATCQVEVLDFLASLDRKGFLVRV